MSTLNLRQDFWRAQLDTTTRTQPSGCRGVRIAPCCSVNAAFLFAEPRMLVVVSKCAHFWPDHHHPFSALTFPSRCDDARSPIDSGFPGRTTNGDSKRTTRNLKCIRLTPRRL